MADKKKPEAKVKVEQGDYTEIEGLGTAEQKVKVVEVNPNEGKNIDERMADLLKDHEAMGAR